VFIRDDGGSGCIKNIGFFFLKLKGQQTIPQGPAFNFFFLVSFTGSVCWVYLFINAPHVWNVSISGRSDVAKT
jgi:hypothetical protein